ncbi:MAG: hypothetical protein NC086_01835 [Alistipes sp.]|nr:hypothetical protein [Alistipes sp.]
MKKKITAAAGMVVLLLLTGCQSGSGNAEVESLEGQIARLEQQLAVLEQQNAAAGNASGAIGETQTTTENTLPEQPAVTGNNSTQAPTGSLTTYTMEELTSMVNAYIEKADAAVPGATASDNMEQFFMLKQEEKQIDNALDIHEDELENLYRQNILTREEYKSLERELEKLEDSLDGAEDRLEYVFGIDD